MTIPEEQIQFQREQDRLRMLKAQQTTQTAKERVETQIKTSRAEFIRVVEPTLLPQLRQRLQSERQVAVTAARLKAKARPQKWRVSFSDPNEGATFQDFRSEKQARDFIKRENLRLTFTPITPITPTKIAQGPSQESLRITNEFINDNLNLFTPTGNIGLDISTIALQTLGDISKFLFGSPNNLGFIGRQRRNLKLSFGELQKFSDKIGAKGNLPTREEINKFLSENPGAKFGPTGFRAKNADEFFARLGQLAVQSSIGGAYEITLPISIGLLPAGSHVDRQYRIIGALLTPSLTDYAFSKVIAKLARLGKRGQTMIRKFMRGDKFSAAEAIEFEKILGNFGVSTTELRQGAKLYDDIPLDQLGTVARRTDDILSDIEGASDWSGGVVDDLKSTPIRQAEALKQAQKALSENRKALEKLVDIDPDTGQLTKWGLLSPREKTKFLKEFQKLLDDFEKNPELFGAGAAYKPASLQDFEDLIKDNVFTDADEYIDFLASYKQGDTLLISPAALTILFEDLSTAAPPELTPARIGPTVDTPFASLTDITEDVIPDVIPDIIDLPEPPIPIVVPDVDIIPDVVPDVVPDVTPIPDVPPTPDKPSPPIQIEEPVVTPAQLRAQTRALRLRQARERRTQVQPTGLRPRIPGKPIRRAPRGDLKLARPENFKVRIRSFIGGEFVKVSAKNFREALIRAEKQRKDKKSEILEMEVSRI